MGYEEESTLVHKGAYSQLRVHTEIFKVRDKDFLVRRAKITLVSGERTILQKNNSRSLKYIELGDFLATKTSIKTKQSSIQSIEYMTNLYAKLFNAILSITLCISA